MFKWLNEQFAVEENVEISAPASKNISEPVLSIIEALKDSTNWEDETYKYYVPHFDKNPTIVLSHIKSELKIRFTRYSGRSGNETTYLCQDSWPTPDESSELGKAFKDFYFSDVIKVKREYQHMINQIEREKFMEAFVK